MFEVGVLCLGHRVVVNVDDVIEHAYSGGDGALQPLYVQLSIPHMGRQVHGTQVAHGDFVFAGVEGDFGAQVGAVHDPFMLLG